MKKYCFETIEECKNEIVSKIILYNSIYNIVTSIISLINMVIRTLYVVVVILTLYNHIFNDCNLFKLIVLEACVYIICAMLIKYFKYKLLNDFICYKIDMIDSYMICCKEFIEKKYSRSEKKDIYKSIMNIIGMDIEFDIL